MGKEKSSEHGSLSRILRFESRKRTDYREFLQRFSILREEAGIDLDSFDYGFYYYGMELYGNMPLIEENEFREIRKVDSLVIAIDTSASCQKVLGGWANIACQYATKRYRSNLINWGMLPLLLDSEGSEKNLPFTNGDWILLPDIRAALIEKREKIMGFVIKGSEMIKIWMTLGELTDRERQIILDGCLINYNRELREKSK